MMKARLLNILVLCLLVSSVALAISMTFDVTPEHGGPGLSVEVHRDANGLLAFTLVLTSGPQYVSAELAVRDSKRTLVTSATPIFTRAESQTFHFSMPPDLVATSDLTLGVSYTGDGFVPAAGTTVYRVHLMEFVPPELLRPADGG
jgi:hypothetical protein